MEQGQSNSQLQLWFMFGVILGYLTELSWEPALCPVCLGPCGVKWALKSPQTQA